ncbi:Putative O-acetyltransferase CAS1 [Durusdinium trenchii]|uniref:O-acetyltransferase CAS1 n=1 Tax=Durusdinium trenchii TaxID=1381693 RepID=A0ABP0KZI5_9DINO
MSGEAVGHKQKSLQANLRQSHDSLSQELAKIDEQRESADRKIESLETQKLHIRQKLQSVDDKLHAAREVQRSCFAERDACRKAVADIEGQFRLQLREAEEEGLLATKEHEAAKKVREMAAQAESLSSQALAAAVDELKTKTVQFDSHLLTVLMDHVSQEERRIEQLGHEAEHCLQIVQKHKAEIQMLNVMDRPAHTVLDSLEHKRLRQTAVAADTALKACAAFVRDFGPFLEKNVEAQARLKKLESDHAQVLRKLAPCREFLGVQSEASQMRGSTPTPSIPAGTLDIPRPVSQLQATSASQAMNNCMPEPSHTPPLLEDPQLELRQPGLQQDLQIMPRRDQQQQSQEPVDHKQDPSKPQGYPQPRVQPQETSQTQQLHQQQMQQEQHQYQQQQHQQPQQQQYHPQSLSIEAKQAEKT